MSRRGTTDYAVRTEQENCNVQHNPGAQLERALLKFSNRLDAANPKLNHELQSVTNPAANHERASWMQMDYKHPQDYRQLHDTIYTPIFQTDSQEEADHIVNTITRALAHPTGAKLNSFKENTDNEHSRFSQELAEDLARNLKAAQKSLGRSLRRGRGAEFTSGIRELNHIAHTINAAQDGRLAFIEEALKTNPDPAVLDEHLFGRAAAKRLGEASWQKVQDYMARDTQLDPTEMRDFVHEMCHQASTAGRQAAEWEDYHRNRFETQNTDVFQVSHPRVWERLEGKSAYLPIEPILHPDPNIQDIWNKVWDNRILEYTRYPGKWENLEAVLSIRQEEVQDYRNSGELPEWIHPERFTDERLTLTPENNALGYNNVHNQPIDLMDRSENIEHYLRERMDTHLNHYTRTNGGLHPAEFAKELIKPYVDKDLAAELHRFDPENWYYTDDGPINYFENTPRIVEGDTAVPSNHLKASYARLLRDSIMERGLAHDAEMDRADLLAMSLPRNAAALQRAAEFSHRLIEEMDPLEPS